MQSLFEKKMCCMVDIFLVMLVIISILKLIVVDLSIIKILWFSFSCFHFSIRNIGNLISLRIG